MRLVIVESPYAPQTPLSNLQCLHQMTCEQAAKIYNSDGVQVNPCIHCRQIAEVLQRREKELKRNNRDLNACLRDCLDRDEAPFASHAIYTRDGVTDDTNARSRAFGIVAGFEWRKAAAATIFYLDLDWSTGMQLGHRNALHLQANNEGCGHVIEFRLLGGDWSIK